jgi:hypothetical protein
VVQLERIDKVAALVATLLAAATGIARFLLSAAESTRVENFALYLVSQAWLDGGLLLCLYAAYRWFRRILADVRVEYGGAAALETLIARHPVQLLLLVSAFVMLLSPLYFLVSGRHYFWTALVQTAYVETYKERIDRLAATGKVQDASILASRVAATLGDEAEGYYLTGRVEQLQHAVDRSAALTNDSSEAWNPITQRDRFFRLAEAIRLNPQNYVAADRLRQMLTAVRENLQRDLDSICDKDFALNRFKGRIRSLLEAQVQRIEASSGGECLPGPAWESWGIHTITCLLYLSDSTKAGNERQGCQEKPYSFWENLPDQWEPAPIVDQEAAEESVWPSFPTPLDAIRAVGGRVVRRFAPTD